VDFSFTEEQQMLLDGTRRLLADKYSVQQRRQTIASSEGYSRSIWQQFSELGLLGLNIPAEEGGLDGGAISTCLVCMAMGEALVIEPYLSSAVVAARAIAKLGSSAQRLEWLPRMNSGALIAVLAHDQSDGPRTPAVLEDTLATRSSDVWRLTGRKAIVYHAPLADLLLISAKLDGASGAGIALFAVPRGASGLKLEAFTTVDGQRAADVVLENVEVPDHSRLAGDVSSTLPLVLDYGTAALCSEAIGVLDKLFSVTVEYCRTRVQFGQPIGRFQALQHRMAEMLMHLEQARSAAYLAASWSESEEESQRAAALCAAKVVIGHAARFVGQQAIQLHGGMGMTDELMVGHYFKRLLAFEVRCGGTESHLREYAERFLELDRDGGAQNVARD
jgi:alkylation response protein AidB-like acyl-CoA dehydrogenase